MAVAPEAGGGLAALVSLLLGLLALFGYLTARGVLAGWNYTLGKMLLWLADELVFRVNLGIAHPRIDLGGPFRSANKAVVGWIGEWADTFDAATGLFFHGAAVIGEWTARETAAIAGDLYSFGGWVAHVFVPAYVQGVTDVFHKATSTTTKVVSRVETKVIHVTRVIRVEAKQAAAVAVPDVLAPDLPALDWLRKHWKAVRRAAIGAAGLAGGLALPGNIGRDWIGYTKRTFRIHRLRLNRLEKILGAAGFAALLANALGLASWRCVTRGNLGRLSRAVCGMDSSLLGSLLQDLLGIVGALSVVEFTNELRAVEEEAVAIMGKLVKEFP